MYKVKFTTQFKKDLKKCEKRGYDMMLAKSVIKDLANKKTLSEKYKDHLLKGDYKGYRECHLAPDWLLIYKIVDDELILFLSRIGTHSDLFKSK